MWVIKRREKPELPSVCTSPSFLLLDEHLDRRDWIEVEDFIPWRSGEVVLAESPPGILRVLGEQLLRAFTVADGRWRLEPGTVFARSV